MTTVNMHQAKSQLSKLVKLAAAGEDVVIACHGEPVARLISLKPKKNDPRPIGLDVGKGWVGNNFNDPMPDDFMKAFE